MQRIAPLMLAALATSALLSLPLDAKESVRTVGRLHRIDMKAKHPKAYHPHIGDLMQVYLDFPIVPEQIVDSIDVAIKGHSVTLVGVVSTSKPKIVGSGQVSVFLTPRLPGLSAVTVTPVIPGQKPKPISMNFLVESARR